MDAGITLIAEQFRVTTNLFTKALDGLDRDAFLRRAGPQSNPPVWIAGHLTQWRARIVTILGGSAEMPWARLFDTGTAVGDLSAYPDAETLLAEWRRLSEQLMARLEGLSSEQLDDFAPPRVASPDGTLRGALALFAFHEGYHVGQLGFLRKWLGHSPLLD